MSTDYQRNGKLLHTSDTALAAWLIVSGIKLVKTIQKNQIAEFVLQGNKHGDIGELLLQWESDTNNVRAFHNTYRYLLKQIHRGR